MTDEKIIKGIVGLQYKIESQKNSWLIDRIIQGLEKLGINLEVSTKSNSVRNDKKIENFVTKIKMTNIANGEIYTSSLQQDLTYEDAEIKAPKEINYDKEMKKDD